MANFQRKRRSHRHSILLSLGLLLTVGGVSACSQSTNEVGENATTTQTDTENVARTAAESQAPQMPATANHPAPTHNDFKSVKVFFPESPDGDGQIAEVEPVWRSTDRIDVAEFAIEQLIAGPRPEEKQQGLTDPFAFQGASNCGGQNFTIGISEQGEATLQFCRAVPSAGVGQDARMTEAIEKTLKQFSTVDSVTILNQYGNCFKDLSGRNLCLKEEDERQVKVFFPLTSEQSDRPNEVEPVWRSTDRVDVAEFAIEQLAAGPQPDEKQQGFIDLINFDGESICGNQNFTIDISERGEATLQFCRTVTPWGVGQEAKMKKAIRNTLQQFSPVDSVTILDKNGDCFKSHTERNLCLE